MYSYFLFISTIVATLACSVILLFADNFNIDKTCHMFSLQPTY